MRFSTREHPVISRLGAVALIGYILTIFAANWSLSHLGNCTGRGPCTIPVWPGLNAPSGVLWAGLAFSLRDAVQEYLGRGWTIVAIAAGALLSAVLSPVLAVASGAAFLIGEGVDFLAYTPLRSRGHWLAAVALSNTVGLVADSILFLWLAFGDLSFLPGQIIGKTWMTLLVIALMLTRRAGRGMEPK